MLSKKNKKRKDRNQTKIDYLSEKSDDASGNVVTDSFEEDMEYNSNFGLAVNGDALVGSSGNTFSNASRSTSTPTSTTATTESETMEVTFDVNIPNYKVDSDGCELFLSKYLNGEDYNYSDFAKFLLLKPDGTTPNEVTSVIKTIYEFTDPTEYEWNKDVFGLVSLVDLSENKSLECLNQIKRYLLKQHQNESSSSYIVSDTNKNDSSNIKMTSLDKFEGILQETCVLFINERVVNLPLSLSPHVHAELFKDLTSKNVILLTRIYEEPSMQHQHYYGTSSTSFDEEDFTNVNDNSSSSRKVQTSTKIKKSKIPHATTTTTTMSSENPGNNNDNGKNQKAKNNNNKRLKQTPKFFKEEEEIFYQHCFHCHVFPIKNNSQSDVSLLSSSSPVSVKGMIMVIKRKEIPSVLEELHQLYDDTVIDNNNNSKNNSNNHGNSS